MFFMTVSFTTTFSERGVRSPEAPREAGVNACDYRRDLAETVGTTTRSESPITPL
jgi:hypothetical protein